LSKALDPLGSICRRSCRGVTMARQAGVLEYWSIEKRHRPVGHYSNTPLLQYAKINSKLDT
jgi:hypothetical protein